MLRDVLTGQEIVLFLLLFVRQTGGIEFCIPIRGIRDIADDVFTGWALVLVVNDDPMLQAFFAEYVPAFHF